MMKRPRRIPALLLALVMALGLTTPALADGKTVAVSTSKPYNPNETISVTLSNVLAVKEMDIIVSYPDFTDDGSLFLEYEIMPITVYCLPRTGSVLTVTTNMETNPHHWIGCALVGQDLQTYDGFDCSQIKGPVYELGRVSIDGNLAGSPAGPDTTTYDINFDMVDSFNETDIYCIYVNYACEFYFTFGDLSGVPSVPMEEVEVKEEEPKEEETHTGLSPYFNECDKTLIDVALLYYYTLTNYTSERIDGYYALLSYDLKRHIAQINEFDIHLDPGQSIQDGINAQFTEFSTMEHVWLTFDSKEERDSLLSSSALRYDYGRYVVEDEQWLKDTFSITE